MKITSVNGYVLNFPQDPPWGYSKGWVTSAPTLLIELSTNEGISGWGESYGPPRPIFEMIQNLTSLNVIGSDPFQTEKLWAMLRHEIRDHSQGGIAMAAISAIDIACWDIKGKALNAPVCKLLGGPVREELECYASAIRYTKDPDQSDSLADPVTLAKIFVDQGFSAIKLAIGMLSISEDIVRIKRVREFLPPDVDLMIDANHAYNSRVAIELAKQIENLDIFWLEDPLAQDDLPGYQSLRQSTSIPLAGGETLSGRPAFRDVLAENIFDVLIPETGLAGGLTEAKKIFDLSDVFGVGCTPHGFASVVGTAAAIHLAASHAPNPSSTRSETLPFEWTPSPLDRFGDLAITPFECANGKIAVPIERPGLGVEIDRDILGRLTGDG
jgi:D-galactarolactone cycloisomerase